MQSDNEIWSVNNITLETFLLKNHTQNVVEKQVPDPFLKNLNSVHFWINTDLTKLRAIEIY